MDKLIVDDKNNQFVTRIELPSHKKRFDELEVLIRQNYESISLLERLLKKVVASLDDIRADLERVTIL